MPNPRGERLVWKQFPAMCMCFEALCVFRRPFDDQYDQWCGPWGRNSDTVPVPEDLNSFVQRHMGKTTRSPSVTWEDHCICKNERGVSFSQSPEKRYPFRLFSTCSVSGLGGHDSHQVVGVAHGPHGGREVHESTRFRTRTQWFRSDETKHGPDCSVQP